MEKSNETTPTIHTTQPENNTTDLPPRQEIVERIRNGHQEKMDLKTLIRHIILIFGEIDSEDINETKLEQILITLLTQDGLNLATFVESNDFMQSPKLIFEYNPINGDSYIKIQDNA